MHAEQRLAPAGVFTVLSDRVNLGCRVLTGLLLAGIVMSNAAEVVLRTAFSTTLDWIFEINLLCATWIYFIGVCQVYHRKGDISVDVLACALPPRLRITWSWAVDLLCVGTFFVIGWYGLQLVQLQWPYKTPGVGLPSASYSAPVVIGAVVMILHVCAQRLRNLARD
ncbi:MAG: TRAP transporter small permease [Acidobacteriota bacterium]